MITKAHKIVDIKVMVISENEHTDWLFVTQFQVLGLLLKYVLSQTGYSYSRFVRILGQPSKHLTEYVTNNNQISNK